MFQRDAAFFFIWIASAFGLAMTILALLAMTVATAHAQVTKIDPLLFSFAREKNIASVAAAAGGTTEGVAKAVSINNEGQLVADCFVEVYNPADAPLVAERLESYGGVARTIAGEIMTAYVPLAAVEEIAGWEEVRYIEAGKPLLSKLSNSIQVVNADRVQAGDDLDKRYDGAGVIVGIVDDTRLDWGHVDFTDAKGDSRILFLWDKGNTGTGVAEIKNSSGLECTRARINAGTCGATSGGSTDSHATHVAGIAAGDDATYKGMAPGADIINVFNVEGDADSGGDLSTTIVDDVRYIFAKAESEGKPAVVNLSLGTSIGAHDDTSAMEKGLNNLVTEEPGRAIVNAAGNEHFNPNDTGANTYVGIHASLNVTIGTNHGFDFAVRNGTNLISLGREVIVDIWQNSTSNCSVELAAMNFGKTAIQFTTGEVPIGTAAAVTALNTTLSVDYQDSSNANNGKRHVIARVTFNGNVTAAQMQDNFSFDVIFRGTCKGDAWIWPDRTATVAFTKRFGGSDRGFGYIYSDGDSERSITIPGTASKLITVASFMDKSTWTDSAGVTHFQTATTGADFTSLGATGGGVGDISPFSSRGLTADGKFKPDIAAPGEPIVSSMSANNTVAGGRKANSRHFKNEGTSMSAPHVAGIIALMFQKNKCLTSTQVKTLLTENAKTDNITGNTLPNGTWGHGKVDAWATMKDVVTFTGKCSTTGVGGEQTTPVTTTTGAASGSGCLHLSGISGNGVAGIILLVILFLLTLSARFISKFGAR